MSESQLAIIAGEHFVAHKLAMLGYVPTLLHHRLPFADLLVSSPSSETTVPVHVRTAGSAAHEASTEAHTIAHLDLRFPLHHRDITRPADHSFFCFVDLHRLSAGAPPDVYIVSALHLRQREAVPNRKYSTLYFERPWQALQPFRNNWDPIKRALATSRPREDQADHWLRPRRAVRAQLISVA